MIEHHNKHIQLDDYGECKDGCAYWVNTCLWTKKKPYESWKKKKKQEKRTVDIHLKTSKHRIGTNKK